MTERLLIEHVNVLVDGYDATFWRDSYRLLADAINEHLSEFVHDDDVAEEAIYIAAVQAAAERLASLVSPAQPDVETGDEADARAERDAVVDPELLRAFRAFVERQVDLPPEAAELLRRNLWNLYDDQSLVSPALSVGAAEAMRLRAMLKGLEKYLEWHGAEHDEDCPGDDTCNCSWKPANDGANDAHRFIGELLTEGHGSSDVGDDIRSRTCADQNSSLVDQSPATPKAEQP